MMSSQSNKRLLAVFIAALLVQAAACFPAKARYDFKADFGKAYMSGVMVILSDDGETRGSLVNEFGVSALDFTCRGGKVRIVSIMKKLDRWYIKMTLRKDIREILKVMETEGSTYTNAGRGITYTFTPLGGE